jgi:peptide/nickel transport system substrate-binding protein
VRIWPLPSRRVARATALSVSAACALAACGGGGSGVSSSSSASAVSVTAAHTFTDLVTEIPLDIDETATPDTASTELLPSWSSELVRPAGAAPGPNAKLPADGAVVPYLATSWERDSGGSYTFQLRRGVRGDSGDPFTAEDVRWSLERAVARSPVAPFLFELAHIDVHNPVTIINSHRVRVNVTSPSPFTLSVLASYDAGIYDRALYRLHATASDPWGLAWGSHHSASFGAYWVAFFVPGRQIVLNANPGFWRTPWYQRVVIHAVPNPGSRLSQVLSGSATHTSQLTWAEFQEAINVGASTGVSATVLQTGPGVIAWHLNVAHGPLANAQVRQALTLGVNRVELANGIDETFDQPDSVSIPAAFGESQPSDYDPREARSLLIAAGYPPGALTIDIDTNNSELQGSAAQVLGFLRDDMVEIGVNLRMSYVDNPDQLLAIEQRGAVESTIDSNTPLLGGPAFLLEELGNAAIDPFSGAAQQHFASSTLQSQLDQLRDSPGGSATSALVATAAQTIDSEMATVNFVAIPSQNVTRSNVTGYAAYTQPVTYYENLHPITQPSG